MSQNNDNHEEKEKRPSSPYVTNKSLKITKKMVREFQPISEVSGRLSDVLRGNVCFFIVRKKTSRRKIEP